MTLVPLASPLVAPCSALVWSACFAILQLTGIARRGVLSGKTSPSGEPTPLRRRDQLMWDARLVSTLHAIVLTVGSAMCFYDALTFEGRGYSGAECVLGISYWPDFWARVFLGYLVYDLIAMLAIRSLWDPSGVLHHFLFAAATVYVLKHSIMKFPFAWLSLCEFSTPLLHIRWYLAVQGKKDGLLYLCNGALLFISFLLIRVVTYTLGMMHLYGLRHYLAGPGMPYLHQGMIYLLGAGGLLNCYWMLSIGKGTVRALRRKPEKIRSA